MEKIGIFGGSFNPVHTEHFKIAKGAIKELNLDKLLVVPTFTSPHKINESMLSGEERFNMLKIAFNGEEKIEISDYEINAKGISYTYLTVLHFKKLYPNAQLYLIMGSDMLENFPTWKNPKIIAENVEIVLLSRKGSDNLNQSAINKIKELYNKEVFFLKTEGECVSSSEVRLRAMLGLEFSSLVNNKVENYIIANNLYKGNKFYDYINKTLPIKRKIHTLGVILTAKSLAKKLNVNEEKVEIASLLHDIAKYEEVEKYEDILPNNCPRDVAHQFIGEYILKTKLGVTDNDILNAVKYHTTGRGNMSTIEKIVYVADLIEPSRQYKMVSYLREVINRDFESGFKICVKEVLDFLKECGGEIYYLTEEAYKFYYQGE